MPFPQAAREAGLRAWISVLRQRHPDVVWVASEDVAVRDNLNAVRVAAAPSRGVAIEDNPVNYLR